MMGGEAALRVSFNIAAWRASSNRMADDGQWRAWAVGELQAQDLPLYKPELAFLPAIQRRRLGSSARLLFDAAWPLAEQAPKCSVVYASHDGEINRSFELWLSLLGENEVSPTSFGLSVHNAQVGQWSMLRGDMHESTALAMAADGLETALSEAYALLHEGAEQVLLVLAEDPIREAFAVAAARAPFPYALALLLERGNDYSLTLIPSEKQQVAQHRYWGGLDWVRFMLSGSLEQTQYYAQRSWCWRKNIL